MATQAEKHAKLSTYLGGFREALADLATTLGPRTVASIPEYVLKPAVVCAVLDPSDKYFVEFMTRDQATAITIDGRHIEPESPDKLGTIYIDASQPLEEVAFPGITSFATSTIAPHACRKAITLKHMASCSQAFYGRFWSEGKWATMTGDVPFTVNSEGSLTIFDHLYGFEQDGREQRRLYSFVQMFGRTEIVPSSIDECRQRAFDDLRTWLFDLEPDASHEWTFDSFLKSIGSEIMNNVLLLGPYNETTKPDFEATRQLIRELGYTPIVLSDAMDVRMHSNVEKLFAAILCSSFVVVLDLSPSGHIAEMAELLNHDFRPVLLLRRGNGSTAFLDDRIRTNPRFRIAQVGELQAASLWNHFLWARRLAEEQSLNFDRINFWRNSD